MSHHICHGLFHIVQDWSQSKNILIIKICSTKGVLDSAKYFTHIQKKRNNTTQYHDAVNTINKCSHKSG